MDTVFSSFPHTSNVSCARYRIFRAHSSSSPFLYCNGLIPPLLPLCFLLPTLISLLSFVVFLFIMGYLFTIRITFPLDVTFGPFVALSFFLLTVSSSRSLFSLVTRCHGPAAIQQLFLVAPKTVMS